MASVRRAELADMPDIIGMAMAFHSEAPAHNWLPFDAGHVHELVENAICNPDHWLPLIAEADDGLAGMALIVAMPTFFGPAMEASDLAFFVEPGRRGSRVALDMLALITNWAVERGCRRLTIAPNTGINHEQTVRFLGRCGFTPQGTVMVMRLDGPAPDTLTSARS